MLVRNPEGDRPYEITWKDVYITCWSGGEHYPPTWAATKTFRVGKGVNPNYPLNISLGSESINEKMVVKFEQDTYLRLIYFVPLCTLTFGIGDSPRLELAAEYAP